MVIAPFSQAAPGPLSQGEEPIKDSGTLNLSAVLRPAYPVHNLSLCEPDFALAAILGAGRRRRLSYDVGHAVAQSIVRCVWIKSLASLPIRRKRSDTYRSDTYCAAWRAKRGNRRRTDRAGNAILRMAARRWPGGCGADLRPQYVGGAASAVSGQAVGRARSDLASRAD